MVTYENFISKLFKKTWNEKLAIKLVEFINEIYDDLDCSYVKNRT